MERIEPGTRDWDECYGGHLFRYHFASQQLKPYGPARILDIACGVGYGSKYLVEHLAAAVIAVDHSQAALAVARTHFTAPNLEFRDLDCECLQGCFAASRLFDGIVSLETLEHLRDPRAFLSALRACISADGVLVLSTPNLDVRAAGEPLSPYHEREYTATELVSLLETAGFGDLSLFGQQLTPVGRLRAELREELLQITSNPAVRVGRFLQQKFRGRSFPRVPLPERLSDFELVIFTSAAECDQLASAGPPVLLAVARPTAGR